MRTYDPLIARFLSADPFIQDPTNSQGLNRYSYVNNSPLMSTDPSGYFLKKLFKKAKWLAPILAIATAALVAWAMPYVLPAVFGNSGLFTAPVFAVFGGGAEASIIGATLTGAGKLLTGAIAGFAGGFVGSAGSVEGGLVGAASGMLFAGAGIIGGEFGTGAGVGAHAVAGCVSAVASKGNCATGAISSVVSKIGTLYVEATLPKAEWVGKMTATAVIGGTATAIAGGKFQNGAMSAAWGYLFNGFSSRGHEYENVSVPICSKSEPGCNAETVFQGLLRNAYPGQPAGSIVETGKTYNVLGNEAAEITVVVDRDRLTVTNITNDSHPFCCGSVTRTVETIGSLIYVRDIGVGSNRGWVNAGKNWLAGKVAFRPSAVRIREYVISSGRWGTSGAAAP